MFGILNKIVAVVSRVASSITNNADGLKSKSGLPAVEIEERIQTLYSRGIADKNRLPNSALEIVVHGTGGGDGTIKQFVNWQLGGELAANWNKGIGLVHFVVGRDGQIVQTIDPHRFWTWHSTSYMHDQFTVGIELCNPSLSNSTPYTNEQYSALAGLCDKIIRENPKCKQIQSHNWTGITYSGIGKPCPGSVFDWQRFINELAARKIKATRVQSEVLSIA